MQIITFAVQAQQSQATFTRKELTVSTKQRDNKMYPSILTKGERVAMEAVLAT
jgi:hypothetical protein